MGRRVRKFDGPSGRGLRIALTGDEYEVSVTGLAVCVICNTISSATYVSVKFSSVIHLTVDNYYLRGFGFISISV